ncbi:SMI1/KNR4 family protein [Streptomyces sp. NPDC018338]|uniref:SMI1/KNR4 family protein n=1 Tax=Streptomyces sp. NPDC018338 TaxID=3157192 RepID=UPI003403BBB0
MESTHQIAPAWTRIVRWLENNAPTTALALGPPATGDAVRLLEESLGFPVPEELNAWLRLNDGSTVLDTESCIFPTAEVFLDCRAIADRYRNSLRVAKEIGDEDWWRPSWIPVTAADGHYGLLLDATTGAVLAYTETDDPRRYAPSPGLWLTAVADSLESGVADRLTRGFRPVVRDGRLVWE